MFLKMSGRTPTVTTFNSTALRRSPRFLHPKNLPEPESPKTPRLESKNNRSRYSCSHLSSKPSISVKRTSTVSAENVTVNLGKSNSCLSSSTGLRRSPRFQSGVNVFSNPDASLEKTRKCYTGKERKNLGKQSVELQKCETFSAGSRKSARMHGGVEGFSRPRAPLKKAQRICVENIRENVKESSNKFQKCAKPVTNSRKSSRSNNEVEGQSGERKSPRLSPQENTGEHVKLIDLKDGLRKSARSQNELEVFEGFRRRSPRFLSPGDNNRRVDKTVDTNSVLPKSSFRENARVVVRKDEVGKRETRLRSSHVAIPRVESDNKRKDNHTDCKELGAHGKRKLQEEGDIGLLSGWTKEQELALQRAYFAANPTPRFWKKVAKLVPGKSAQDCFDKVHSDHLTPRPHQPRSRANRSNTLHRGSDPPSASRILGLSEPKIKKLRCNKHKTHLTQKAMRNLLQKHYEVDQEYEADFFSVLEPQATPCTHTSQESMTLSTPDHVQGKSIYLQKLHERSSSDHKKPRSRFSSSIESALLSPPVLKPVKNRALHEKYIDQLHSREARRKIASVKTTKSTLGEEDRRGSPVHKMSAITAARNALAFDARDAIDQFKCLQANPSSNSYEFDDDGGDEDDEDENGS